MKVMAGGTLALSSGGEEDAGGDEVEASWMRLHPKMKKLKKRCGRTRRSLVDKPAGPRGSR